MKKGVAIGICVAVGMLFCEQAFAVNAVSDGYWDSPSTWDTGVPNSGMSADINGGYRVTVTNEGAACLYLRPGVLAGHSGCVNIDGGSLTAARMYLGYYGHGVVTQSAGTVKFTTTVWSMPANASGSGTYVLTGGNFLPAAVIVGAQGYGRYVQTGGSMTNTGAFTVGAKAGYGADVDISGGNISLLTANGDLYMGNVVGATGVVVQSGGSVYVDSELRVGNYGKGDYTISGGAFTVGSVVRMGVYAAAQGTLAINGGTVDFKSSFNPASPLGPSTLQVIGSDADIQIGGDMRMDTANCTLKVDLDAAGVSVIRINGHAILNNAMLDIGVLQNFSGQVGDTFNVLRVPSAKNIYISGLSIINPVGYEFEYEVRESVDGYDWLTLRLVGVVKTSIPGADGGGVAYDYSLNELEVTAAEYAAYLNAQVNNEITITNGEVWLSATSDLLCLTTMAEEKAYIVYDAEATAGQQFSAAPDRGDHPMIYVTWFGAGAYCNAQSATENLLPVYDPSNGWTAMMENSGYRLPTEAEWIKAAAWDATGQVFRVYGTGADMLSTNDANYLNSSDVCEGQAVPTCPVGSFETASYYGLKDAAGNVWEWCHGFYDASGADPDTDAHAVRGGSWGNLPAGLGSAVRSGLKPGDAGDTVGFRVCVP